MPTLRYCLELIVHWGLPLVIQLWDRRELSKEQLDRSWNFATWGSAVFWLGPLSMIGWGWVTRKNAEGLFLGITCTIAIGATMEGLHYVASAALGIPP